MFERFTEPARRSIVLAQEEARSLGYGYIGTEHLLLALAREGDLAGLLQRWDVTLEGLRFDVGDRTSGAGPPPGHLPFTPRAKRSLEMALREAFDQDDETITAAHVMLGVLRVEGASARQLLLRRGVALEDLRSALTERATAAEPPGGPPHMRPPRSDALAALREEVAGLRHEVASLRALIEQRPTDEAS